MSSTHQTRQRLKNSKQNPGQNESSARTNERALADESLEDNPEARNEQHGNDHATPSAHFLEGLNRVVNAEISVDELEELGWKIYTFEEQETKIKLHFDI